MLPPDPKKLLPNQAANSPPEHLADSQEVAGPAAPPPAVSAPPGLGTMLHALRRCWLWALPLATLAGLLATAAALYFYPGTYTSAVVFRVTVRAAHGSQEDEGHFSNVQKAYIARLLSHDVLAEAIQKSEVAEKYGVNYTPQSLGKLLKPAFLQGPEIMTVQLAGENPEALAAVLNALGEAFPAKMTSEEEARVKARILQLRRRLDLEGDRRDPGRPLTLAEQLRDKRVELAKAEKDAGLDDSATIKSKYQHAMSMLASAQRDYAARKQELQGIQPSRDVRQTVSPIKVSDVEVEEALERNPRYIEAQDNIKALRASITKMATRYSGRTLERYTEKDRALLEEWRDHAKALERRTRQKLEARQEAQRAEEERKAREAALEKKAALDRQVSLLETEVQRWTKDMEELRNGGPKAPPEVEALRDQVKQLEKEYNTVGTEVASLEGSLPLPPRVTRHAEAFAPQERETARSQKVALAVGVLSFLGVAAALCLWEATGRRVYSSADVQHGLGLRILGTLPRLPSSARKKTPTAQALGGLDARYGLTEAVDAIRTVLMNAPRNDGARVILVTSALGGEGKTSLASHLAASLARAWRKTLLIDGDLRKPALHAQFDLPLEPGFSEALRGEIEFEDAVKPTMTSRLWLMPAGKVDGHSLQALAQEGLGNVFEQLKEQYDFVVIDTSPVMLVPDGLLLAQQADTVLLSVMKDHSRIPAVYAAQQKLEALGIRVLGSVMIGEKTETYGHAVPYPRQGGAAGER